MWNSNFERIEMIELKNRTDGDLENGHVEMDWDDVVTMMTTHLIREEKNGACFMPVLMKPRSEWVLSPARRNNKPTFRNDANIEAITMAVIDLDQPGALEKAEQTFKDFEYVVYSTHSYTKDTPYKFRMVLKLEKPIVAEKWPDAFRMLVMGIDADKSCGNLSRLFYLPSASLDSELTPIAKHNIGMSLNEEHIIRIGKNHELTLTDDEKNILKKNSAPFLPKQNRHFSGEVSIQKPVQYRTIDYTYEGMKNRHKKLIDNLVLDDSRHNFALKVISREISICKENIDLNCLIQFLYRASDEFSSKSISKGNTAEELPEMIESAFIKYAPELLNEDRLDGDNIESFVIKAINNAEKSALSGKWAFSDRLISVERKNKINLLSDGDIDYSYSALRKRNFSQIKEMISSDDIFQFAKSVIENEFMSFGDKLNINYIGQFIFFCYANYLSKVNNINDISQKINSATEILTAGRDSLARLTTNSEQESIQMSKYINTSFLLASKSAKGERQWQFGKAIESTTELKI